jgi:hypothetical protein
MGNFLIGASTGAILVVFLFWGSITQDTTQRYSQKRCAEEVLPLVRRADRDIVKVRYYLDHWSGDPGWLARYQTLYRNAVELANEQHDNYEKFCDGKPWNDGTP